MLSDSQKTALRRQAEELCRSHGATLLYLTLSGSILYGTDSPGTSDTDVRGIFLPSPDSLILGADPAHLRFSTAKAGERNTPDDVDIDLWPLARWLLKLLPAGDSGALDLLFSPSHAACTLYRDPILDPVFNTPLRLVDAARSRACMDYCLGQAKKYSLKGARIRALKKTRDWLRAHCPSPDPARRLRDNLDALIADCADGEFCSSATANGEKALQLCGKLHAGSIRLTEFITRVEADIRRFGTRAGDAAQNAGMDCKALSHALRSLMQLEELLRNGHIVFPLAGREELTAIKRGQFSQEDINTRILERLNALDILRSNAPYPGTFDRAFAESCILACYKPPSRPLPPASFHVTQGFPVPAPTVEAIVRRLDTAERKNGVRVLYACESGSRGWGFASEDSDFDVRFIYVHMPDWYLGIAPEEKRDVLELGIEQTPVGELDINGWELRKALKLFRISNPPLLEWLSSPIIYRERGLLATRLREIAPLCVSPIRIWCHYRSLMEKSRARYGKRRPTLKTWFYTLRPLLAMRWIEERRGIPPMRFDRLLDGVITCPALRVELDELVDIKKRGGEGDNFTPPPLVAAFVEEELTRLAGLPPELSPARETADLDALFRTALAEAWGIPSRDFVWKL